jgi:hypothetical protein
MRMVVTEQAFAVLLVGHTLKTVTVLQIPLPQLTTRESAPPGEG